MNASVVRRRTGRSVVAAAAYRAGVRLVHDKAQGAVHDYTKKGGILARGIRAPENLPKWVYDRSKLWNAVEQTEINRNAQLAREITVNFPAFYRDSKGRIVREGDETAETDQERRELFRSKVESGEYELETLPAQMMREMLESYIQENFVSKGMIADYAIHKPAKHNDERNYHAHILLTMRRVDGDGFSPTKERAWNNRALVSRWRESWASKVNQALEERQYSAKVYHESFKKRGVDHIPEHYEGSAVRSKERQGIRTERGDLNREIRDGNYKKYLARLTSRKSVFSKAALERAIKVSGMDSAEEISRLQDQGILVELFDAVSGKSLNMFTTSQIRQEEEAVVQQATELSLRFGYSVDKSAINKALSKYDSLTEDQREAFDYALSDGGLKIIEGLAGAGKSHTLKAVRTALEASGYNVIGVSHLNSVVADMAADGFKGARTVGSLTWHYDFAQKEGNSLYRMPFRLDSKTVLIVDEAAMLSVKQDKKLFDMVKATGAKLIYVGDHRQLDSIERGGMFKHYAMKIGSRKLTTLFRYKSQWLAGCAAQFANYNFAKGLNLLAANSKNSLFWSDKLSDAQEDLVCEWSKDNLSGKKTSFVFAYTNAEVDSLNSRIQAVRLEAGAVSHLASFDIEFNKGNNLVGNKRISIGQGDRLQFKKTAYLLTKDKKKIKVANGFLGTVQKISADGMSIAVRLDTGDLAYINTEEYKHFDLGYAGTIYKGQGKTLDQTYLLHNRVWNSSAAYVALTRGRHPPKLFVARSIARDISSLAAQLSRQANGLTSLDFSAGTQKPAAKNAPAGNRKPDL